MTIRTTLALVALAAAAALPGCRSKATSRIPSFPNSTQSSAMPNVETPAGTLIRTRRVTPEPVIRVAAFYRDELVAKGGWSEGYTIGPTFTDGNLDVVGPPADTSSTATPVDPTRPGGRVVVYEYENRTYVEIFEHVPKT